MYKCHVLPQLKCSYLRTFIMTAADFVDVRLTYYYYHYKEYTHTWNIIMYIAVYQCFYM